eukprot:410078-Pelagomonas_calceolata.AAC.2
MEKTFKCYITEDPKAKARAVICKSQRELKEKLNKLEADLASARNGMALGYKVGIIEPPYQDFNAVKL